MALLPCGEQGPILMVHPRRLLDPIRFQDSMQGILIDFADAPVEALVDSWHAAATRAVDTIAPF